MSVAGSAVASVQVVNRLIEGLPRAARNRVLSLTEPVNLKFGAVLCEANQRLQHVFFPLTGFISLVAIVNCHPPLEIGLIGNEGMLGATLALGVKGARLRGIVHGSGTALRMTAGQFRLELRSSYSLRRTIDHYLFVVLAQQSRTIACTRFHEINSRLARCLLMTHDRAHSDHFHLTHQYLADMLGVQRSAVTIAAGVLQKNKVISYTRGEILILDRRGLESASCECYRAVIEDHQRLFA
jgi:CRP-like cAMP-binding protein